jgi:hypothetical protein
MALPASRSMRFAAMQYAEFQLILPDGQISRLAV